MRTERQDNLGDAAGGDDGSFLSEFFLDAIQHTVDHRGIAKYDAASHAVYGIFAKALNQEAVDYIYELKRRPRDKALNLNVADEKAIRLYSKNQPSYLTKLVDSFLPGPLTIILQANDKVPDWIHSGLDTVGFRIPAHLKTLELIRIFS